RIDTIGRRMADNWHFRREDTMRTCGRLACIAAMLMSLTGMAVADNIRVLSVGAVQHAVKALAAEFGKESGHHVVLTIGSPLVLMRKIKEGGGVEEVILAAPAVGGLDHDVW